MSLASIFALARWLGPWSGTTSPRGVTCRTEAIAGGRPLAAHVYEDPRRAPIGAYLVVPGLHPQGPADPRLDRFCRVLAAAGFIVCAPLLPDHLRLRVAPGAAGDAARAFDWVEAASARLGLARPAVFSVSFGSAPAIELAGRASHRDRVGGLVLFGGFGDFDAIVRFAVTGHVRSNGRDLTLPRDPLNTPAVFLNLLDHLDVPGDRAALEAAWYAMVDRTWGKMELKAPGARDPYAHAIAATLAPELRELFLVGCGIHPGAEELLERGLGAAGDSLRFTDPRPHLARVAAPVVIVHGREDDVIPWLEADKLRAALPPGHPHHVYVTGAYGHTGAERLRVRRLADEARTMIAMLRALVAAPRGGLAHG